MDSPIEITADTDRRLARAVRLARLLDAQFRIPLTPIRFGLDALVGLLPVAGDAVMAVGSLVIVFEAWKCGVGGAMITRMLVNVALDAGVGSIPVLGDIFDIWFKGNQRNAVMLEEALATRVPSDPNS